MEFGQMVYTVKQNLAKRDSSNKQRDNKIINILFLIWFVEKIISDNAQFINKYHWS